MEGGGVRAEGSSVVVWRTREQLQRYIFFGKESREGWEGDVGFWIISVGWRDGRVRQMLGVRQRRRVLVVSMNAINGRTVDGGSGHAPDR